MAYDQDLANRGREQLAGADAVTEQAMFGGLAFLLGGNMAVALSRHGLMVRVGRDHLGDAVEQPHAERWAMGGRPMKDWVMVGTDGLATDEQLRQWVGRGATFARSLPPKR